MYSAVLALTLTGTGSRWWPGYPAMTPSLCQLALGGRVHTPSGSQVTLSPSRSMKITIKTLQQKVFHVSFIFCPPLYLLLTLLFQVEADPADTISILKEKIAADQGHPVATQKIIFSGISTRS